MTLDVLSLLNKSEEANGVLVYYYSYYCIFDARVGMSLSCRQWLEAESRYTDSAVL